MIDLIRLEVLKLRTTPAFYVTAVMAFLLSLVSAVTNVVLKPNAGGPPMGSSAHVHHVLSQPSAVGSMAIFILGVIVIAGEYRQRTILTTFLAEPRRLRVVVAKLLTTGVLGGLIAGVTYLATLAVVTPLYAGKGVHHLPVDVVSLGLGTVLSGVCYGLLGVAVGALTRSTVAAIVAGLIWMQVVEVAILENAFPALARWLPVGAAQGLTSDDAVHFLSQNVAALVLVGWAAALVVVAARSSTRRELR
jgi:ABC-type transport system involved in multi-copper enzyme maturation permease subunit